MRKARLLSTVAATLLLTVDVASAQAPKKDKAPAPAPAAQQSTPAERVVPTMKAGEKNADTHETSASVGQIPKAPDGYKARTTDKGAMEQGAVDKPMGKDAGAKFPTDANGSANTQPKAAQSTTGQGETGGSAKLSPEQRTHEIVAILEA